MPATLAASSMLRWLESLSGDLVGGAPGEEAQVYYGIGPMVGDPLIGSSATSGQRPSSRQAGTEAALTPNPNKEEATNINDLMGAI